MPISSIHLSVQSDHSPAAGELRDPVNRATIEFFDGFEPSSGSSRISFSASDGLNPKQFSSAYSTEFGEFHYISEGCVSDAKMFESSASLANVDPALLANADMAGISNMMNEQVTFEALNSELLSSMPNMKSALNGELTYSELTQLIADIQAQVLDLNSLSKDMFGDLSRDVNNAVLDISELDSSYLLSSIQIDSSMFAQPELMGNFHSLAFEATLDGLFTAPEAFPLTLDFSNPNSIQEASELFALTGSSSSISSAAGQSESDGGISGSSTGYSDHA